MDFFLTYVQKKGKAVTKDIRSRDPYMVQKKCQTDGYNIDSGVLLMRHMESYMGGSVSKWVCDLCVTQRKQATLMVTLRQKYLAKLLLSEYNECKSQFEVDMDDWENGDVDIRKKKYTQGGKALFIN